MLGAIPRSPRRVVVAGSSSGAFHRCALAAGLEAVQLEDAQGAFAGAIVIGAPENPAQVWGTLRALLGRRGRLFVALGPGEAVALLPELSAAGLEPKELVLLHRRPCGPPTDALVVAACAKPGGLVVRRLEAVPGG